MTVDDEKAKGHVALKGFVGICREWDCTEEEMMQLLGGVSRSTLVKYETLPHVTLSQDTLERISYILGIYESLRVMSYIQRPNAPIVGFDWKPVSHLFLERQPWTLWR